MRTLRSISIASAFASFLLIFLCSRIISAICSPIVKAGLSELIGSWKIIAMRSPRSSRRRSGGWRSRSSPSNRISPPAMRPGGCGTRPMIASAVTLLPQPDSPTSPSVGPASSERLTPSPARSSVAGPSSAKWTLRSLTSSNLIFDQGAIGNACRARARGQAAHERLVALEAYLIEPAQLDERLGVVVDADVEKGIVLGRGHEQRRRLLAALVAAGGVARRERGDETFAECASGLSEGFCCCLEDCRTGQHVARHGKCLSGELSAPIDACLARMRRDCAVAIDKVKLTVIPAFVLADDARHDLRSGNTLGEQIQGFRTIVRIDEGLGADDADAGAPMGAVRADGEEPAGHRDAEGAVRVPRDDGPGHARDDSKKKGRFRRPLACVRLFLKTPALPPAPPAPPAPRSPPARRPAAARPPAPCGCCGRQGRCRRESAGRQSRSPS